MVAIDWAPVKNFFSKNMVRADPVVEPSAHYEAGVFRQVL